VSFCKAFCHLLMALRSAECRAIYGVHCLLRVHHLLSALSFESALSYAHRVCVRYPRWFTVAVIFNDLQNSNVCTFPSHLFARRWRRSYIYIGANWTRQLRERCTDCHTNRHCTHVQHVRRWRGIQTRSGSVRVNADQDRATWPQLSWTAACCDPHQVHSGQSHRKTMTGVIHMSVGAATMTSSMMSWPKNHSVDTSVASTRWQQKLVHCIRDSP